MHQRLELNNFESKTLYFAFTLDSGICCYPYVKTNFKFCKQKYDNVVKLLIME